MCVSLTIVTAQRPTFAQVRCLPWAPSRRWRDSGEVVPLGVMVGAHLVLDEHPGAREGCLELIGGASVLR